jgi:predicted metalloendopeptidase
MEASKEEFVEITEPTGKFIIENATGIQLPDGAYYHYSEVCKLLKLYALKDSKKVLEVKN